ncbi:MAG TPA: Rieske 2Fe-2S domain-containing protein [Bradyrhizobium sp.]|nr:Rieske 2Fe-2S domain-containing protein [Bradyrhizobium sp.]
MMTIEENERLTRVGPGTPMGELLRHYWMPIAISSDLRERPVRRRLLGEDLVVFRTGDGRVGVVEPRCAHRRTDLAIGVCEAAGIRCGYHGWAYDLEGKCIEQPAEPRLNPRVRIKAYPAQELGGLIFTYMGPRPAPLLPRFDLYVWDHVIRDIGHAMLDFNWLQAMENSVDPHHVEWLHGRFMNFWRRTEGTQQVQVLTKKHLKVGFDPFEFGIIKRRVLEGHTEDDDDWKIGHPLVFPIILRVGGGGIDQFQIRVPIDDTHTWHVWYTTYRPEGVDIPTQQGIPSYSVPLFDDHGEPILDFIDGQDIFVWAGQGTISDRSRETLGTSDRGVGMLRRMLFEQLEIVAKGGDPLGVIRDPERNRCIELPMEKNKYGEGRAFRRELLNFQAIRHSPLQPMLVDLFERSTS